MFPPDQPDVSILRALLRTAENVFFRHPILLFGVIVDVVLVVLAFSWSDHRPMVLLSVVGVSAAVLVLWGLKKGSNGGTVSITGSHGVEITGSLNRRRDETTVEVTGSTNVTIANSLNSAQEPPAEEDPANN